jgi:hypothetical protein
MPNSFDITVLPIYRRDGYDQSSLPGLHVAAPPRRAARGRRNDRLVILAAFEGNIRFSSEQQANLLANIEKLYYRTSGSVTAALQDVVESLNKYLLDRNLQSASQNQQLVGLLSMVVIKDDHIFMVQCGPVHGFLLNQQEIEHVYDANRAGRGLGLSRTPAFRLFQAQLASGTLLVLTPKLPTGWNEGTLQSAFGQTLATLRRRFLSHAGADLSAVTLLANPGSGQIKTIRSGAALDEPEIAQSTPKAPPVAAPVQTPTPSVRQPAPQRSDEWEQVNIPKAEQPARPAPIEQMARKPAPDAERKAGTPRQTPFGPALLQAGRRTNEFFQQLTRRASALLGRMLPGEGTISLPASTMAITAIAVPLVVVTVSMVVYVRVGRESQYQAYFAQAQNVGEYALTQTEPQDQRAAWETTLFYLDKAEQYRETGETAALRQQAQTSVDELDGVTRLEFQSAIAGTLGTPTQVHITRMAATSNDLYLLNSATGSILRARLTGTGYEIDPDFRCGPGPYGAIIVEDLVDLSPLPRPTEENATLVAMDGNGNLLYCVPDGAPLAVSLVPPDSNWGEPRRITIDEDNLYVLDPLTNAVWIYFGEEYSFTSAPRFFFANEVPPMQTVIDMAVNGEDLFLLHADGQMATCVFSSLAEAPTTCVEEASYIDNRPGGGQVTRVPGASFSQIVRTTRPEPSLYFLDAAARSIYQFSLRLNFVRQYQPDDGLPAGEATALTVSPNRAVFIALGNQVLIAFPP